MQSRKFPIRAVSLVVLAVALCVGFVVVRSNQTHANAKEEPKGAVEIQVAAPTEVTVERAEVSRLDEPIRVTGTLRTDESVVLSTKATGLVKAVNAKEGDRVRRGQLLIVIDDSDLRAQRARAVAAVRSAQAQVHEGDAAVRAAQAKVAQARTSRGIKDVAAETDHRRAVQALSVAQNRLSQAKSMAGIAGTEAESRVASAKASLQASRERLKALQEGARKQEKAAAEAAVNRATTQVNRTRSMLQRREMLLKEGAIAKEVVDNAMRDYEAALADLDAAKQQLSLVEEGPRTEEIRAQEEVIRQGEAAVRDAEANRARRQISDQDVEAAQTAVQQAEAAVDAAKANLAQSSWNEEDIRSAQAALAQARATAIRYRSAVRQMQADVDYQDELIAQTRIMSPVNGVVTERKVQTGAAVVQMRNELMTLVSLDTVYFEASAPETSLPFLKPGLPATVMLDAQPGKQFPGVVREIIPVAQNNNRSVRVRISIPKPQGATRVVGGFARAMIQGVSNGDVVSVPREAIVSDDGETAVFLFEGGKAHRRPVRIGDAGGVGDRVPIISGLTGGERVIVGEVMRSAYCVRRRMPAYHPLNAAPARSPPLTQYGIRNTRVDA
jgi:HlyD family secretion protein